MRCNALKRSNWLFKMQKLESLGNWANREMGKWANGEMGKWGNGQIGNCASSCHMQMGMESLGSGAKAEEAEEAEAANA
jgi:hypothetical protein